MDDERILLDFILPNDGAVDHLELVERLLLLMVVGGVWLSIPVEKSIVMQNEITRPPCFDMFAYTIANGRRVNAPRLSPRL